MQQRKLAGRDVRISVDHTYFGESGDSDGIELAPDRYCGTILDWKEKKSADPKVRVKYDGESTAVTCPLATLLQEKFGCRLEAFVDGSSAPIFVEAPAPAPAAARPRAAHAARAAYAGGDEGADDEPGAEAEDSERREDGSVADEAAAEDDEDDDDDDDDDDAESASGSDVELDDEVYGVVTVGPYTWTRLPEDGVKTDARGTKPRAVGSFIKKTGLGNMVSVWEHMVPPAFIEAHVEHTNPHLSTLSLGDDRLLSKGESIKFWGCAPHATIACLVFLRQNLSTPLCSTYSCAPVHTTITLRSFSVASLFHFPHRYCLAFCCIKGVPLRKMWQQKMGPDDLVPPPSMGAHGMSENRWLLLRARSRFGPLPTADDTWNFIRPMEDGFNAHMVKIYTPGWLFAPDETMDPWLGEQGPGPDKIPNRSFVRRKPKPLGAEVKSAGDATTGMKIRNETCCGKQTHEGLDFFRKPDRPHTTATTLRLVAPWLGEGRVTAGDSWFAGMKTVIAFLEKGEDFIGDVKTNHSGCCVAALTKVTPRESGGSAVYETTLELSSGVEKKVWLVSHRRGGKAHIFITTCGTTLPGKPRIRKLENGDGGLEEGDSELILERKCPKVLNDFTLAQPTIDRFNRYRQHILAMEERILTRRFDFRHSQFYWAESFVNAYFAHKLLNDKNAKFFDCMKTLAYGMMHNSLLVAENPGRPLPPLPHEVRAAATPGPPSAGGSSSGEKAHTVVPISAVVGRKRGRAHQPRCVMCNDQVTTCCLQCSTPGNIVGLHKKSVKYNNEMRTHLCHSQHSANPTHFPRGKKGCAGKAPQRSGSVHPAVAPDLFVEESWLFEEF